MRRISLSTFRQTAAAAAVVLPILAAPVSAAAQQASLQAPAAAAPAPAKPDPEDYWFVKGLFVNLGDDLKHVPRKNSLYSVAAGTLGLAVHPIDDDLSGGFSDKFFAPGKSSVRFPSSWERAS